MVITVPYRADDFVILLASDAPCLYLRLAERQFLPVRIRIRRAEKFYALLDKGVSNHEEQACCTAILGGGSCSSVFSPDRDGIVAVGRSGDLVHGSGSRSAWRGTGRGWPHSGIEQYRIRVFHQEPRYVPGSGRCCPGPGSEDESRPMLRLSSAAGGRGDQSVCESSGGLRRQGRRNRFRALLCQSERAGTRGEVREESRRNGGRRRARSLHHHRPDRRERLHTRAAE